jgi:hypothetical protein
MNEQITEKEESLAGIATLHIKTYCEILIIKIV